MDPRISGEYVALIPFSGNGRRIIGYSDDLDQAKEMAKTFEGGTWYTWVMRSNDLAELILTDTSFDLAHPIAQYKDMEMYKSVKE